MRSDCKIDDRKVACPNTSHLGFDLPFLKAGLCFVYESDAGLHFARSLGHVTAPAIGDDKEPFDGIVAMVLSEDHTFAFERWIEPHRVRQIFHAPTEFMAWFLQPSLPYDADTMRRLMEYGTVAQTHIANVDQRAKEFTSGVTVEMRRGLATFP